MKGALLSLIHIFGKHGGHIRRRLLGGHQVARGGDLAGGHLGEGGIHDA